MSLEGQQIDRYRILRLLGSGGMGEVYLAEDARIEQQVALKVIRAEASPYPDVQASQEAARLFQREAKAIAKLDHPHILPLYDYGEQRLGTLTLIYLVMPYRQEGSLADWLRRRGQAGLLSAQEVAHFISQAASALQHAHDRQIIHQDVKSSNFLLRHRSETPTRPDLLLADFGIARLSTATASASQSIRGTPTYMAPEQWEGHPVPATDQYALAVMAYELLTGRPPFQGAPGPLMYQHLLTPPPPPSSFQPHLSQEIDTVLLHALAKRPEQRFASVTFFANAFQQAVQARQGIDAPPSGARAPAPASEVRAVLAISAQEAQTGTTRTLMLPGGRQMWVSVPAGVRDGQSVRLQGQGDVSSEGGAAGTLILTIQVITAQEAPSLFTMSATPAEATVLTARPETSAPSVPTISTTGREPTVSSTTRPEVVTPRSLSISPMEGATPADQGSFPSTPSALPVKPSVRREREMPPSAQTEPPASVVPTGRSSQAPAPVTAQASSSTAARSLETLQPAQRGISRRAVMLGLAGLAVVGVVGGGLAWLTHMQGASGSSLAPSPTATSAPSPTATPSPLPRHNAAFSDEFNGQLDPRWVWVDPSGDSTHLVTAQGFLRIVTPHANKDLFPTSNFNAPRLLQPIVGNFTVETRVRFNPTYYYEGAGILVWGNTPAPSFLRFEHAYADFSGLEFDQYVNGTYTKLRSAFQAFNPGPQVTATLLDLRLQRTGDIFTASWRDPSSSQAWQLLGETSAHFDSIQVGLVLVAQAQSGNPDVATSADYDYFRIS